MQIVINIPEDLYEGIERRDGALETECVCDELMKAVDNGTSLPKGHGRLGDLDTLETEIINGIKAGNYEDGYERFPHINDMDDCVECVKYSDTIIEADEAESEDKE